MKIFRYKVELTNDNDNDYYKTGLVINENKEIAEKQVYQYYDKKLLIMYVQEFYSQK